MNYIDSVLDINWVTAVLALFVCVIIYVFNQRTQLPPGPRGFPYLGYYPYMSKDFLFQLRDMTKPYGDVFCFTCTGQLYVYLGTIRAIKEAHVTKSDCFTEKPRNFSVLMDIFGEGVIGVNGETWKEMRKFFVQRLKEFGMSKKTQEGLIADYLEKTVNDIMKLQGENFNARTYLMDTCTKIIHSMFLSGCKIDEDDIRTFNEAYLAITESLLGTNSLLTGPLLKLKMLVHPEFKGYQRNKLLANSVLAKVIKEHEKSFDKDKIRNVVDYYIMTRKQLEEKGDPKSKSYTEETTVGGCRVPKGAITLVGLWASSHDPNVYEQPEKFDPTRFLPNKEKKPKCTPPPFFGIGKRSCIGEPLVLMETFLFVSTLLQNFDLHPAKDSGTTGSPDDKKETEGLNIAFRLTPRKC